MLSWRLTTYLEKDQRCPLWNAKGTLTSRGAPAQGLPPTGQAVGGVNPGSLQPHFLAPEMARRIAGLLLKCIVSSHTPIVWRAARCLHTCQLRHLGRFSEGLRPHIQVAANLGAAPSTALPGLQIACFLPEQTTEGALWRFICCGPPSVDPSGPVLKVTSYSQ